MDLLYTIAIAVVSLAILITIHEYGHFWVARRCGVKVLRFSVGFGRPLLVWRDRHDTEFVVAAIPLGGYVKMLDAREGEVDPALRDQEFTSKPVSARIAIVAAGPLANLALAVVAFWAMFVHGVTGMAPIVGGVAPGSLAEQAGLESRQEIVSVDGVATPTTQALLMALLGRIGDTGDIEISARYPDSSLVYQSSVPVERWLAGEDDPDPFGGLGLTLYRPVIEAVVGTIAEGSAAVEAGLLPGDRLLTADGKPLADWQAWVEYVRARPGEVIALGILRGGESLSIAITPRRVSDENGQSMGQVGVGVKAPEIPASLLREERYGVLAAWHPALLKTWETTTFTLESIRKMVEGLISPKNLSGPITIAKVASASARSGLESWLAFLALLSVSLGVLNLLPIPVLDGGHLLFYFIEAVKGSPVSEQVQLAGFKIGMAILVGLMGLALYNDIMRL